VVVTRNVDRRRDVLGENTVKRVPDMDAFDRRDRFQKLSDQRARPFDGHRIRIVIVGAGKFAQRFGIVHRLVDSVFCCTACSSSARVLILRNESASSSNGTSVTASVAYQASILRPPFSRKLARCDKTLRCTRANTGCDCSNVFATASCAPSRTSAAQSRATRSAGRNGESQGAVTTYAVAALVNPACSPASGPAKPPTASLTTQCPNAR